MHAERVDPRDIGFESDLLAYRVYFWHRSSDANSMWSSNEWRLTGADVTEVRDWAEAHSASRYYTVGVEFGDQHGNLGLLRLHGWEPPRPDKPPSFVLTAEG